MKSAIVAIAKNEDHYIDEWIEYHLKIGFDRVFVYQNNWRYSGSKYKDDVRVSMIECDGQRMQTTAYDSFVRDFGNEYDWAAFFDIDEFLVMKNTDSKTLNEELERFGDVQAIGVPWRVFGSSGCESGFKTGNFSIIDRFTKSDDRLCEYKKMIVNIRRLGTNISFQDPHYLKGGIVSVDSARRFTTVTSLFPSGIKDVSDETLELNHYMLLTFEERESRKMCGDSFYGDEHNKAEDIEKRRRWWNDLDTKTNRISNMTAYELMHTEKTNGRVVSVMKCRLGNILFQYGAGLTYARKHGKEFIPVYKDDFTKNHMNNIDGLGELCSKLSFSDGIVTSDFKKIEEDREFLMTEIQNVDGDVCLEGFFQSETFMDSDIVRNALRTDEKTTEYILDKYDGISDGVGISVRRGDYLRMTDVFVTMDADYYIKSYNDNFQGLKCFISSDDIEWCKRNINIPNSVFVEEESELNMRVLAKCKHHILSCSTFSWWAAWLEEREDSVNIVPYPWFNPKCGINDTKIIPERWKKYRY